MRVILIKLFVRFLALLPLSVAHALGHGSGCLFYSLPNRNRSIARKNIDLCYPQLSVNQREKLLKACLIETGKTAFEMPALLLWPYRRIAKLIVMVHGKELIDEASKKNKGVIFLSPHLGAWEIGGLFLAAWHPFTILYKPPKIKQLDGFIRTARQRGGSTLVPTNNSGIRALWKALKRHEQVGILPDQDPGREGGVYAAFFGIQTNTMTLWHRLAQKNGAEVILIYAERLPKAKGFHLHLEKLASNIGDQTPEMAAAFLNETIERHVRRIPSQYQWIYKRFKTRPGGEPQIY